MSKENNAFVIRSTAQLVFLSTNQHNVASKDLPTQYLVEPPSSESVQRDQVFRLQTAQTDHCVSPFDNDYNALDTDRHQRQRYDQDVAYHIKQPSSESVHSESLIRFYLLRLILQSNQENHGNFVQSDQGIWPLSQCNHSSLLLSFRFTLTKQLYTKRNNTSWHSQHAFKATTPTLSIGKPTRPQTVELKKLMHRHQALRLVWFSLSFTESDTLQTSDQSLGQDDRLQRLHVTKPAATSQFPVDLVVRYRLPYDLQNRRECSDHKVKEMLTVVATKLNGGSYSRVVPTASVFSSRPSHHYLVLLVDSAHWTAKQISSTWISFREWWMQRRGRVALALADGQMRGTKTWKEISKLDRHVVE